MIGHPAKTVPVVFPKAEDELQFGRLKRHL